jgi:uncharacterized membrane protein
MKREDGYRQHGVSGLGTPSTERPPTRGSRSLWVAILRRAVPDAPVSSGSGASGATYNHGGGGSGVLKAMEEAAVHVAHDAAHAGADVLQRTEKAGKHAIDNAARAGGELAHAAEHAASALRREPFWQAQAVLCAAVILYLALPSKLVEGPGWLMPVAELLLVGGLWLDRPRRSRCEAARERRIVLGLLALVALSNFASLELLVHYLLRGGKAGGHQLLLSSIVIWLTNVAVFALIFWQLDRGGPDRRARREERSADFLFAQMTDAELVRDWHPTFIDYLYTSYTNATAFSPTDTLPLTSSAKLLMMSQSSVSLITLALVAARAVNILS